jgi:hypothetical protein
METKRQCKTVEDDVNPLFHHLEMACIHKFKMIFEYITPYFEIHHKIEVFELFRRWLDIINHYAILSTDDYFYRVDQYLKRHPNTADFNEDVEKICCVFILIVAKLHMDDICAEGSLIDIVRRSDYLKTGVRISRDNKNIRFHPVYIPILFHNEMKKALCILRNETLVRLPIYHFMNIQNVLTHMMEIEKIVADQLQWRFINPFFVKDLSEDVKDKQDGHQVGAIVDYGVCVRIPSYHHLRSRKRQGDHCLDESSYC